MLKLEFTDDEINIFKSKIKFTDRQERIIEYRRKELSIVEMADKENCGTATISREIKDIERKMKKVL